MKKHPTKKGLHARSKHNDKYDFELLIQHYPKLKDFVQVNPYGNESIDFFNDKAVKALNKALLITHYGVKEWDIPEGFLCPPIPGRAEYIHHAADLLGRYNNKIVPTGNRVKCLDIGVGANCIYPLIGNSEYGWSFVGTEINAKSIENAQHIVDQNPHLKEAIEFRLQKKLPNVFTGIIQDNEFFDLAICNPPFHASAEEAMAGSLRKLRNLKKKKAVKPQLNFGGQAAELWTEGGEKAFITSMVNESKQFGKQVFWFTSLVSKEDHLSAIYTAIRKAGATVYDTIKLSHGNKTSRIVTWTFLTPHERSKWAKRYS